MWRSRERLFWFCFVRWEGLEPTACWQGAERKQSERPLRKGWEAGLRLSLATDQEKAIFSWQQQESREDGCGYCKFGGMIAGKGGSDMWCFTFCLWSNGEVIRGHDTNFWLTQAQGIEYKKYIWSLSLVPGTELLKPLEFPEWQQCPLLLQTNPFWSQQSLC